MTALQYVYNLLESKWEDSISGRPRDVGELGEDIKIVYESSDEWKRMDLANYDYLTLVDGGITDITPRSFGWTEEDSTSRVDIDIRTAGHPGEGRPGRIALYGERGAGSLADNEAPNWGGLVGEAMRCVRTVRKGDKEFNLIENSETNDLSSQIGGQRWRAVVSVALEQRASQIDTTT